MSPDPRLIRTHELAYQLASTASPMPYDDPEIDYQELDRLVFWCEDCGWCCHREEESEARPGVCDECAYSE